MNKKIYQICNVVLAVTLSLTSASCSYLDVVPPETVDLSNVMRDKNDALAFLYSCYAATNYSMACNNLGAVESSADEFVNPLLWGRLNQVVSWNQLSSTTVTNWSPADLPWESTYDAIGYCHLFLNTLANNKPSGVTETDRIRWRAEISFLLAYYHFRVLESYGPVPIIDKFYPQDTPKSEFPGRYHFDYCVDKIVSWLDEAAAVLPATVPETELGRATSTICLALKARVLVYAASPLWNGSFPFHNWKNTSFETPGYGLELVNTTYDPQKWVRAKKACEEALVLALGDGKRELFSLEASENLRTAAEIPLPDIPNTSDDFKKKVMQFRYLFASNETLGNKELVWGIIPRYANTAIDAMPHAIVVMNSGNVNGGVCAMNPVLYAAEHFYTKNGKLPKYDAGFSPETEWFHNTGVRDIIRLNNNREARFYATLSFDGDEYGPGYTDGGRFYVDLKNSIKQGYNPDRFNRDNNVTGYFLKKWAYPGVQWLASGPVMNVLNYPLPVIRLPELYLNLAECCAATSDVEGALDNLNVIRERAGIEKLTQDDITSQMSLDDWIRNERYVELFAEGHRYYDVRRWMIAPQVLKAGVREGLNAIEKKDPTFEEFNKRVVIDQPFQWDDRMYLLPVKSSEIYSNPQMVQAPLY
ncbi:MAG: RagB/SusD family nutrient uptake outer membrane protein [Candidatus Cryptobacteroides sp.]|nr:RagB/SusD family nutrient uptake outer membrane protein [Candidatus Cryptobacteroides sp.]